MKTVNIRFQYLLDELRNYNPPLYKRDKAIRVYRLCLSQNHIVLASKIHKKYIENNTERSSDMALAFGWALMAQKDKTDENL